MHHQVSELDTKAKEIMLLKFGRVVDLDRLEGLTVNRTVQELQERLRTMERKASRELAALEVGTCTAYTYEWCDLMHSL